MNQNKKNKIPIISFYSGGGFLDMGFEMAGFDLVWTNEIDVTFAKLHSSGITSWRESRGVANKAEIFNTKSIEEIETSEIISQAFPIGKPKYFGIIGGPPCQDFSMNGKLKGFGGERGRLTVVFIDKIFELTPSFFVMENVPGLIISKSIKNHLSKLLKKLESNYYVDHATLNALNFGVPQNRERLFFIGINKNIINKDEIIINLNGKWFNWPPPKYENALKSFVWPEPTKFGGALNQPDDIPYELCVQSCLISKADYDKIPNSDEYFKLYISQKKLLSIKEGETNRPSFKRLHRYKYSPTACYGNNEVHLHPIENRRISVREALRIQGVPDSYILPPDLPLSKKFKMIGNGVPVPLAYAIAKSIKKVMIEKILK